jgi:uncharacterized secreted protein with C-terminal beta-propeller domain
MRRFVSMSWIVLAVACTQSTPAKPVTPEDARLTPVESCEELETYIEDVAIDEMERAQAQRGQRALEGDDAGGFDADADADGDGDVVSDGSTDVALPPDHSDTNVQEEGVDEADIVKTDGDYVYVLTQGWLVVADAYPATELHEVSRTRVYGAPLDMFVSGDQAVVFTSSMGVDAPTEIGLDWWGTGVVKTTVVSLADRAVPEVVREVWTEGTYLGSRRIGDAVHFVVEGWRPGPEMWAGDTDGNRNVIRAATLDTWVPRRVEVNRATDGLRHSDKVAPCESFRRPARPDGRGVVAISTLRLDDPAAPLATAAVVGQGGVLYASEDSLFVASAPFFSTWGWWGWAAGVGHDEFSYVHEFDLSPAGAVYRASGAVPGHVLNSFSMDEEDGFLRLATTVGAEWGPNGITSPAQSHLFILEEDDGLLVEASSIRDLAPGEAVYSARFEGDVGYVVTFPDDSVLVNPDPIVAEDDPLFTFDLSDPHAPELLGELHIPGFSNYVHRIDAGHLLTIGHDTDDDGRVTGLQLSLFDVTDLSNPTRTFTHSLGMTFADSEATTNHHAFAWFADLGMVAVPVTDFTQSTPFIGMKVLSVDVDAGFNEVATIDHAPYYGGTYEFGYEYWSWDGFSQVRRALTIEDQLYTVSGRAIVASPVADLTQTTSSLALPDPIDPWN